MPIRVTVEKYAQLNGHKGAVYAIAEADIPNHVFTAGSDGIIARWDVKNGISSGALAQVQAPIFSLLYDADSHLLWAGREDGGLHVIDTQARKEIKLLKNHEKGVFSIIKNKNRIYTSGGDGTVAVTDTENLQTIQLFQVSEKKVRGLYFSAETDLLYTAAADGRIRVYPPNFPQPFLEWEAHDDAANVIAALSENTLITGGRDARLKVWKLNGDQVTLLENIPAHNYAVYQIKTFPELGVFITCSRDKNIKIWDMETLQVLKRIERVNHGGHKNSVNGVVFLPHLQKLVSVSDDGSVIVWEITFGDAF